MKSIKIRLEFNNEQQTYARQHCGVARHAWNWGLSVCKAALERHENCPSAIDLHKKLVAEVKSENPWYYDVSKCAPQQALRDLNTALKRYLGLSVSKLQKTRTKRSFLYRGSDRSEGRPDQITSIWVGENE